MLVEKIVSTCETLQIKTSAQSTTQPADIVPGLTKVIPAAMTDQLEKSVREVISVGLLLAFFTASCFAQAALDRCTRCDLGSDFETVQVDRLPRAMTRTVDTPSGTK